MAVSVDEMNTALDEISLVLRNLVGNFGPKSKVFVKVDEWSRASTGEAFLCCHLAVAYRHGPTAKDTTLEQAGWFSLETVGAPTSAKAKFLQQRWKEYDSLSIYSFVSYVWDECLGWKYPSSLEIGAAGELWGDFLVSDVADIVKQAQGDWALLIAEEGFVIFSYVQLVPVSHPKSGVRARFTKTATRGVKTGGSPRSKSKRVSV